jgi:hypothetical protein
MGVQVKLVEENPTVGQPHQRSTIKADWVGGGVEEGERGRDTACQCAIAASVPAHNATLTSRRGGPEHSIPHIEQVAGKVLLAHTHGGQ